MSTDKQQTQTTRSLSDCGLSDRQALLAITPDGQITATPDPKDLAIEALEDRVRELEIEVEYAWRLVQNREQK